MFYRNRLLNACYQLLLPVAKFLLRSGLSFREFQELGRLAFVHVAEKDFGVRGRSTNVSRIAAITGVPRKEVARIRGRKGEYVADSRIDLSLLGDVLHLWATDPRFCDLLGQPKALPAEGDVSFETLITQCSADLPANTIRSELLRCKAIDLDEQGSARITRRYIVSDNFDEKLLLGLSVSLRYLAETVCFNSDPTRTAPGRIERFVRSEPLSEAARELVRLEIRERITQYSERMDDMFAPYESLGEMEHRTSVGVGFFYWEEEQ